LRLRRGGRPGGAGQRSGRRHLPGDPGDDAAENGAPHAGRRGQPDLYHQSRLGPESAGRGAARPSRGLQMTNENPPPQKTEAAAEDEEVAALAEEAVKAVTEAAAEGESPVEVAEDAADAGAPVAAAGDAEAESDPDSDSGDAVDDEHPTREM